MDVAVPGQEMSEAEMLAIDLRDLADQIEDGLDDADSQEREDNILWMQEIRDGLTEQINALGGH